MYLQCRFCLEVNEKLEPLFGTENFPLTNQIATLNNLSLEIKDFDGWPSRICLDCKSKLTVTHNFIIGYLKSHKILKEQFGANLNNTFDEEDDSSQKSSQSSQLEDEDSSVHSEEWNSDSDFNGFTPSDSGDSRSLFGSQSEQTDDNGNIVFDERAKQFKFVPPKKTEFVCKICNKICKSRGYLKVHQRLHSSERPFKCDICSETFQFKQFATKHIRNHKRRCIECDILFKSPKALKAHLRASPRHNR